MCVTENDIWLRTSQTEAKSSLGFTIKLFGILSRSENEGRSSIWITPRKNFKCIRRLLHTFLVNLINSSNRRTNKQRAD